MKVVVMANPNTFQILSAEGCPPEFKASNGWTIGEDKFYDYQMSSVRNLVNMRKCADVYKIGAESYLPALAALHEMVYQPKPIFSDDGSIATMEHGKFRIEEWAGGQVVFQVLEMDEEFRGSQRVQNEHKNVRSSIRPSSTNQSVWLRGENTKGDFDIITHSELNRQQIISALRYWDQNWPGWTRKTPTLKECCQFGSLETGGVFVFESEVK